MKEEGFSVKKEIKDDYYMEKYGIAEHEVCYDAGTMKKAKEIEKDPKRIAAIKDYLGDEVDENTEMMKSFDELEEYVEKKTGKGKEVYNEPVDVDSYEEPEKEMTSKKKVKA